MTSKKNNIFGVIGDIHAEDRLLEKAVSFLSDFRVEVILCVGDIVDGRGDVDRCCGILQRNNIQVVRGNHEQWFLGRSMRDLPNATQFDAVSQKAIDYLRSLPLMYEIPVAGGVLLLCHGIGENTMAKVTPDDYGYALEANMDLQGILDEDKYRYIVNGHTHKPMVRRFGRVTIINAGTLRRDQSPGFLIVDFHRRVVRNFTFNNTFNIEELPTASLIPQEKDLLIR